MLRTLLILGFFMTSLVAFTGCKTTQQTDEAKPAACCSACASECNCCTGAECKCETCKCDDSCKAEKAPLPPLNLSAVECCNSCDEGCDCCTDKDCNCDSCECSDGKCEPKAVNKDCCK